MRGRGLVCNRAIGDLLCYSGNEAGDIVAIERERDGVIDGSALQVVLQRAVLCDVCWINDARIMPC